MRLEKLLRATHADVTHSDVVQAIRELDRRTQPPYGDGRPALSLNGWERIVDRRLARKRSGR